MQTPESRDSPTSTPYHHSVRPQASRPLLPLASLSPQLHPATLSSMVVSWCLFHSHLFPGYIESQRVIKSELVLIKNVHTLCTSCCMYNKLSLLHFVCFSWKKALPLLHPTFIYLLCVEMCHRPSEVREGEAFGCSMMSWKDCEPWFQSGRCPALGQVTWTLSHHFFTVSHSRGLLWALQEPRIKE